jgi:hypothetical protein
MTRAELENLIDETFFTNGAEAITGEEANVCVKAILAAAILSDEVDAYADKIETPVENDLLACDAVGNAKVSGITIAQVNALLSNIDLTNSKLTTEGGYAVLMMNIGGPVVKGNVVLPALGAESGFQYIDNFKPTGVTASNNDDGRFYLKVRNYYDGGTQHFQVNIYKNAGMTELVGHVADVDLAGEYLNTIQTIIEDNASGLGGTLYPGSVSTPANNLYDDYVMNPENSVRKSSYASDADICFMVAYDDIIMNGYEGWFVRAGIAEVLVKDSTAISWGEYAVAENGRAKKNAAIDTATLHGYLTQIGRFIESKAAGTDVLCKMLLK